MTERHMQDLAHPDFWLVAALEWPGAVARAAALLAVAPQTLHGLSGPACVDGLARLAVECHAAKPRKVVFLADLAPWLNAAGRSWESEGVDWREALAVLSASDAPVLAERLTVDYDAWLLAGTNASTIAVRGGPGGTTTRAAALPRSVLRARLASEIAGDWPGYVQQMTRDGLIAVL